MIKHQDVLSLVHQARANAALGTLSRGLVRHLAEALEAEHGRVERAAAIVMCDCARQHRWQVCERDRCGAAMAMAITGKDEAP